MDTLSYLIIIFLLVLLVLVAGLYAYLLKLRLNQTERRLRDLRKDAEVLDLQVEALKLLINMYHGLFPSTIAQDVDAERKKASERSCFASNKQIAKDAALEERRWKVLQNWVKKNF